MHSKLEHGKRDTCTLPRTLLAPFVPSKLSPFSSYGLSEKNWILSRTKDTQDQKLTQQRRRHCRNLQLLLRRLHPAQQIPKISITEITRCTNNLKNVQFFAAQQRGHDQPDREAKIFAYKRFLRGSGDHKHTGAFSCQFQNISKNFQPHNRHPQMLKPYLLLFFYTTLI